VCFWEDDPIQFAKPDDGAGANTVTLHQARLNYQEFGASERRFIHLVRPPTENELRRA
jgi:hypothetical protein